MPDYETQFYCKLGAFSSDRMRASGRASWGASGIRSADAPKRGKLYRARRRHPAFYRGRRVHPAYYRTIIRRPYGAKAQEVGWQDRFGSNKLSELGTCFVCVYSDLDPQGIWTYGGVYDYQVPYVAPGWIKWARRFEKAKESGQR